MKHYITFEDTKEGNASWARLSRIDEITDFTSMEYSDPSKYPEPWFTQYFTSDDLLPDETVSHLSNLPGVIDCRFNLDENGNEVSFDSTEVE